MATEEVAIDPREQVSSAEDELIHALETLGEGSIAIPPRGFESPPPDQQPSHPDQPGSGFPSVSPGLPGRLPVQAPAPVPSAVPASAVPPVTQGAPSPPTKPSQSQEEEPDVADLLSRLEVAVKENPMVWTAGAVALGFAIALILRPPPGEGGENRRKSKPRKDSPLDGLSDAVEDFLRPAAEKFIREELTKVFGSSDIPFLREEDKSDSPTSDSPS